MMPPANVVLVIGGANEILSPPIVDALRAAGLTVHHASEATAVEALEARVANDAPPAAVLITGGTKKPTHVARGVHVAAPLVQIVFIPGTERVDQLFGELPHAGIGHYWTFVEPGLGAASLARELRKAVRATRTRANLRTTLDRMNLRLQRPAPTTDPAEYRRLVISDRYLATILEHAGDAIVAVDPHDRITIWNRGAVRLFGHGEAQAMERPVHLLVDEEHAGQLRTLVASARTGESVERHEVTCVRSDGTRFGAEATLAPVRDETGRVEAVSLVIRDVTERIRQEEHLRTLNADLEAALATIDAHRRELLEVNAELEVRATTDPLTGLKNRMVFHNSLDEMIAVAARQDAPLSLLVIDVDHFKRINDTFGHLEGDRVLRGVAHALRSRVREQDVVARFGGEEFVILLPNTCLDDAVTLAESIRRSFGRLADLPAAITVSIGVAQYVEGDTAVTLIDRADQALLRAKNAGRDRVARELPARRAAT